MNGVIWGTSKIADGELMTADITKAVRMNGARHCRFKLASAASGTRAGVIYIQESNDGSTADNNCTLTNKTSGAVSSSITVTTLTAVDAIVDITTDAPWLLVFFDFTSGTGSFNVWATVKE